MAGDKVLLTGATGFLGSHLAYSLLKAGYKVLAYKRKESNIWRVRDVAKEIAWYDTEKIDKPFIENKKINCILHTATAYGRHGEKFSHLAETNILFPLKLIELSNYYESDTFINTDTTLEKNVNPYSLSKKHFYEWLRIAYNNSKVINIKLEHIYGPKDDNGKFINYIIDGCLRNIPEIKLTTGEQKRDFLYIDDAVAGYLCILKQVNNLSGKFINIELGSGTSFAIKDVVNMIGALTGSRSQFLFGAIPFREKEAMDSKADISFLKSLAWQPKIALETGLQITIREMEDKRCGI